MTWPLLTVAGLASGVAQALSRHQLAPGIDVRLSGKLPEWRPALFVVHSDPDVQP